VALQQRISFTNQRFAGQVLVRQLLDDSGESLTVVPLAIGEADELGVQIAEKMDRLNRVVGSVDAPLELGPEVFDGVDADAAFGVAFSMVDYLVNVVNIQPGVRLQRVSEHRRALLHMGAYDWVDRWFEA
jgi:phage terminase large subunit-like protein